jgi:hypothetical protein
MCAPTGAKEEDHMDGNVSSRRTAGRTKRGLFAAAVAGIMLLLVAACGGGGGKKATSGNSPGGPITVQALDKFAVCMRQNGVASFYFAPYGSSPTSNAELSLRGYLVPGVGPNTPNFSSAMKACHSVDPVAPPPAASHKQFETLLREAECMRTHGFPTYPDPTEANGRLTEVPLPSSIDQNSPEFLKAQKTCGA